VLQELADASFWCLVKSFEGAGLQQRDRLGCLDGDDALVARDAQLTLI